MKKRTDTSVFQSSSQAMKKFLVSLCIVGAFFIYSFTHSRTSLGANAAATSGGTSVTQVSPTPSTGDASATPGATSTPTTTPGSLYKNGSYTGSVADAQWGLVQVKVVIQNGKLTSVQFLQYPNERNRSIEINNYADPQLISEAIQAQSAQVDVITGATDTSEAFMQSLGDALSAAHA